MATPTIWLMAQDPPLGVDLTKNMIETLGEPDGPLPHPLTTDALLDEHMQALTSAIAGRRRLGTDASRRTRLKAHAKWLLTGQSDAETLDAQALDSILEVLHQLNHRTLQQRRDRA